MKMLLNEAPIPESPVEAASALRTLLRDSRPLSLIDKQTFLSGWAGLAYLAPGLHPDEFDNPEGGWPVGWKPIAEEAFARSERNELTDQELYPYRAGMKGLGIRLEIDEDDD